MARPSSGYGLRRPRVSSEYHHFVTAVDARRRLVAVWVRAGCCSPRPCWPLRSLLDSGGPRRNMPAYGAIGVAQSVSAVRAYWRSFKNNSRRRSLRLFGSSGSGPVWLLANLADLTRPVLVYSSFGRSPRLAMALSAIWATGLSRYAGLPAVLAESGFLQLAACPNGSCPSTFLALLGCETYALRLRGCFRLCGSGRWF